MPLVERIDDEQPDEVVADRLVVDRKHPELPARPELKAECGSPWLDSAERWRSLFDDEDVARLFCPGCAEREFGGS